jgi:hypothetical protein
MHTRGLVCMIILGSFPMLGRADTPVIDVKDGDDAIRITTDALSATIKKKGYVSGVSAGTLVDAKTKAHDLGSGLHIMDFLLAPGWKDGDEYPRDAKYHGNLPKHYVEGPQICTQAKELKPEIIKGKDFVAVRMSWKFTKPAPGLKAGSTWEQTLVFLPGKRYFLSAEKITSVNDVDDLFYRIDMPGHIKHKNGDSFSQVYLSYLPKAVPSSEFVKDFAPDEKFLYQRQADKIPERLIRAYQIKQDDKPGPWLAGMTLDPAEVCEAWCHQRSYVCFIEELHRKKVKAGESFGAAYVVGFFDAVAEMEKVYDGYKGTTGIAIEDGKYKLVK